MSTLYSRASTTDVGTNAHSLLGLWLACQIFAGHIFLPLLVVIFANGAKRHATLINLCCVWIVSGICSCLLFYTGTHKGPEPPIELCLTQSSLLYGVPPMTAVAVFSLIIQVWLTIRIPGGGILESRWGSYISTFLIAIPYITFATWSTAAAIVGIQIPERVSRNRRFFYCSIQHDPFTNGIGVFCAIVLVSTMVFEVWIGVILHKQWRALRSGSRGLGQIDFQLILRVVFFGVYVFVGLILSVLSIKAPKSPVPDLWIASVAPMVVFIFGSQKDVLTTVLFWRRTKDPNTTLVDSNVGVERKPSNASSKWV